METAIAPQSRKIELHDGEETPSLLEEIIFEEIFPKLPVKSLLKFRCVAKSWCSLIGSKRFIKAHLNNSIKSSNLAHHRILIKSFWEEFKLCSLPSFDMPFTNLTPYYADFVRDFEYESLDLVGSCNGILCFLIDKKRFILWNPATKMFNNLPGFDHMKSERILTYGFGFDESNHGYKVFGTWVFRSSTDESIHFIGKVYSLRTNSWEVIEVGGDASHYMGVGFYASGKLHWRRLDLIYSCDIVSFDLSSHVYGLVGLPSCTEGKFFQWLGVLRGCLSVHKFHRNGDLDVWLMKEYGVRDSWENVATVSFYNDLPNDSIPNPLRIGPNWEILLIYQSSFVIYNPKCDVYQRAQITGRHPQFHDMGMYIESLVSVAPDAEEES